MPSLARRYIIFLPSFVSYVTIYLIKCYTPPEPYMTSKHIARSGNPPILSEITNRTPFIKRDSTSQTVSSIFSKPLKSFRVFDDSTTLSTHRISSTRKSSRLPLSANKNFETPNTAGDHWNVSDITIDASIHQDENAPEENYDELEYLPPTAIGK